MLQKVASTYSCIASTKLNSGPLKQRAASWLSSNWRGWNLLPGRQSFLAQKAKPIQFAKCTSGTGSQVESSKWNENGEEKREGQLIIVVCHRTSLLCPWNFNSDSWDTNFPLSRWETKRFGFLVRESLPVGRNFVSLASNLYAKRSATHTTKQPQLLTATNRRALFWGNLKRPLDWPPVSLCLWQPNKPIDREANTRDEINGNSQISCTINYKTQTFLSPFIHLLSWQRSRGAFVGVAGSLSLLLSGHCCISGKKVEAHR